MAVLNIKWGTAARVSPATAVTTPREGEEAEEESAAPRADKPILVWVHDPIDEEANAKIAKVTLDPDKVRVGSAYFQCVKMTKEEALADPLIAESGKECPRMVLVTPDYEVAAVVEGKISSSKLYAAMKKAAKKSYKCNFDKNVKGIIKILGELDKIANEREMIAKKEADDPKPAELKKLAKEKSELEEHEKDVIERREKLMNPELKSAA